MEVAVDAMAGGMERGGFRGGKDALSQLKVALCLLGAKTTQQTAVREDDDPLVGRIIERDGIAFVDLTRLSSRENRTGFAFGKVNLTKLEAVIGPGNALEDI